jgi:putative ABC transport system substrate-binding protein
MKRRIYVFICLLSTVLLLTVSLIGAQQATKIPRVGYLSGGTGKATAFRQGLRELGYVDGQNIIIVVRHGKRDRLPALAAELVRLRVDVLFALSTTRALVFKNATRTIPIVFSSAVDPVTAGLVNNLARPGGNLTGVTHIAPELAGKRLELLKETIPKLSHVAVLWHPGNLGSEQIWKESQLAARGLGLQLYSMEVTSAGKFESAFQEATKARSPALAVTLSSLISRNRTRIADLAIKNRLLAIYADSRFVSSGGLMSYGVDRIELRRRALTYLDKILKGAKPADLPVMGPEKFELVINLKTAKKIGVTIPPEVLYRADKFIR